MEELIIHTKKEKEVLDITEEVRSLLNPFFHHRSLARSPRGKGRARTGALAENRAD